MASRPLRGCRFLLASLTLLLVSFPALQELAKPLLLIAVVASIFVAGVVAVAPGWPLVRTSVAVALIQIVLTLAAVILDGDSFAYRLAVGLGLAATTFLIVFCIYCVLRYVLEARNITRDQIYAGISVYLMLGFAFGCVYYLINILYPGGFAVNNARLLAETPDLMYFSFVTLATVGYGDITPAAKTTRALAQLEALMGMIYVAVFMARLVSLYSVAGAAGELSPAGETPDVSNSMGRPEPVKTKSHCR
jgi:hypothetical protein